MKVQLESSARVPVSYQTLFFGLKRNHASNVAVVHPIIFLLRRVILASVIVFMDKVHAWGVLIVMACTLTMLGYVLTLSQWREKSVNC